MKLFCTDNHIVRSFLMDGIFLIPKAKEAFTIGAKGDCDPTPMIGPISTIMCRIMSGF